MITTFILIPVTIVGLFLLPLIAFSLAILLVCTLGIWEWGKLASLSSFSQRLQLSIFCGLILALIIFIIPIYQVFTITWQVRFVLWIAFAWWLLAILLVFYYPKSAIFWRDSKLLRLIFGILTILPFFWSVLALRQYHYSINHFSGAWWLFYVMALVWSIDSGAYIFGYIFGHHKMIPKISPNKTWEGLIGGLVISVLVSCLFSKYAPVNIMSLPLIICSVAVILAAVLGDLTESMFKREAGIKDSGYFIPGHGGILDRIDSLTAAVPIFTYLILLVFHYT